MNRFRRQPGIAPTRRRRTGRDDNWVDADWHGGKRNRGKTLSQNQRQVPSAPIRPTSCGNNQHGSNNPGRNQHQRKLLRRQSQHLFAEERNERQHHSERQRQQQTDDQYPREDRMQLA